MSATCDSERTVTIVNKHGLHARPAAEFVKLAGTFSAEITVARDDTEVNGKSIMGMMMLAAECGSTLRIRTEGPDAERALAALAALVAEGFGEELADDADAGTGAGS
jgi:phosphocarrier protein